MDTNSEKVLEEQLGRMKLISTGNVKFFAEYLPKVSILSLYITLHSSIDIKDSSILVSGTSIVICYLKNLKLKFSELSFEVQQTPQKVAAVQGNIFYYRIITKPPASSVGSSLAELIPSISGFESGISQMLKYSQIPFVPKEKDRYGISCRYCNQVLCPEVVFKVVRELPGLNWEEKATDLWCHPPCSQSDVSETVSCTKSQLTVFDILNAPDITSCYFSSSFYALSPMLLKHIKLESEKNSRVLCDTCENEIGLRFSENCVHLWDFGISWNSESSKPDEPAPNPNALFENFKRSVFSSICEWSYGPTCQFLIKSLNHDASVLLWNCDKDLTIFQLELEIRDENDTILLKPEKVAKFMFHEKVNENGLNNSVKCMFPVSHDCELLVIPDSVFKIGLAKLRETSLLYLNDELFKYGFLTYRSD